MKAELVRLLLSMHLGTLGQSAHRTAHCSLRPDAVVSCDVYERLAADDVQFVCVAVDLTPACRARASMSVTQPRQLQRRTPRTFQVAAARLRARRVRFSGDFSGDVAGGFSGIGWVVGGRATRGANGVAAQSVDRVPGTIERSEFASVLNVLVSGDEGEVNEVRALQLLADRGGQTVTSRPLASLYGSSSHSRVRPALVRLRARGLVDERDGNWYTVDPLFNEWLRRPSPLADRTVFEASDES